MSKTPTKTPSGIRCAHAKLMAVSGLKPHPRNPNTHPKAQIDLLAKIIQHQGFRSPIVVSKRSGFIVAGHARLEAAKVIGLEKVPVDEQDFDSDADELAHLLADNRLAELAEIDLSSIPGILDDLREMKIDLDLAGFDALGLIDLGFVVPEFASQPKDEETRLDKLKPIQCPKCGHQWTNQN